MNDDEYHLQFPNTFGKNKQLFPNIFGKTGQLFPKIFGKKNAILLKISIFAASILNSKKMKRKLYGSLLKWKNDPDRKPLVLEGARQVGKTWLLKEFGKNRAAIVDFLKEFINSDEYVLFDGTSIVSNSERMNINREGYNSHRVYDPQINLMMAFSETKHMPGYYRVIPGNIRDAQASILRADHRGGSHPS